MTSEVALLNRSAVALAADSAATVRRWERDHYENYYYKGTNKIFQLSAIHPVGIMIYATASLQGAPWDVLIKSYRDQLGERPHDHLDGYVRDLFEYIASSTYVFAADIQEQQFKNDVDIVAARIYNRMQADDRYKGAPTDEERRTIAAILVEEVRGDIHAAAFVGNAEQSDVDSALARYSTVITDMLDKDKFYDNYKKIFSLDELARLSIEGQFKLSFTNLNSTGLVVAGFGDKDFFPQLLAYRCFGLVLGKLIISEEKDKHRTISQRDGSAFMSFAQDDMIQTFTFGMSGRVLSELETRFRSAMDRLCDDLRDADLLADIDDEEKRAKLASAKRKAVDSYGDNVIDYSFKEHSLPLRSVLSSLPFDELAELAHTLVLLESLKERVTSSSASVSGPIDVAIISKNDGFIWIKRKHYFDPQLNPRYFAIRGLPRSAP